MTWGEFKKAVEAKGVSDNDKLDWIDVSVELDTGNLHVSRDHRGVAIS